jgi:hypothetical protein
MRQTKESPAKAEKRSMGCPQPSASPFTSTTRPPPFARRAAELRRYVDWLGADRAASILNVNPESPSGRIMSDLSLLPACAA